MSWYVIYTKSRYEKKVEALLLEKGFTAYCPKRTVARQWSDRIKMVVEPLFRSYVFVQMDLHQKYDILNTQGVVKFVNFKGEMAEIRDEEIDRIKALLGEFDHADIEIDSYQANDSVTIGSGPFMDNEGIVMEIKGHKTILYLAALGIKIEVDQEKNILKKNTNQNNRILLPQNANK